jgi:hypothetical protein
MKSQRYGEVYVMSSIYWGCAAECSMDSNIEIIPMQKHLNIHPHTARPDTNSGSVTPIGWYPSRNQQEGRQRECKNNVPSTRHHSAERKTKHGSERTAWDR